MKKHALVLIASITALAFPVQAQMGRISGPSFTGAMAKLFGDNPSFTADVEIQMEGSGQASRSMPGKLSVDAGKSRMDMDMSGATGGQPGAAERMKAMGMDKIVAITRPDTKVVDTVFPGLSAYTETPMKDTDATNSDSAFKVESTELAKETVDGHACVKNKVVVTDDQGKTHESTVWNATDMKKFPVKIETIEQGHTVTMLFKNVKLTKPDAAVFEPPADCKKYDSQQALMQEVMKRMTGGMTPPPAHP